MSAGLVGERYRLYEPVGTGGMGRVWLARDEMLRRDVAIKEVGLPSWLTEAERNELRARTLREARAAARLNHPNVIQIYDVVQTEEQPWIVMEYVASRSLQDVITRDGPVTPERAAQIGLALLAGLRTAHNSGVLHRDVKPHNVLIGAGGRVVLTDFGLATFDGGDGAVTRAGLILGSPQYVAPERARAGVSTEESDLWSLGATLYAAVEGRSPYARPTTMATLAALATEPPPAATRAGGLRPVLQGLLRKDPKQRLTVEQTELLLKKAAVGGHRQSSRMLPRPRSSTEDIPGELDFSDSRRRPRWWPTAALAALITVVAGAMAIAGLNPGAPSGGAGPTGQSTGAAVSPQPVALPGTRACTDNPGVATKPLVLPPTSPGKNLIDGYVWHVDQAGFRIPVLRGWKSFRAGDVVCFRGKDDYPVLGVDLSKRADADLLAQATADRAALKAAGAIPDYNEMELVRLGLTGPGVEWQYKYREDETTMHALQRYVPAGKRAYAVFIISTEQDWPSAAAIFNLVRAGFPGGL